MGKNDNHLIRFAEGTGRNLGKATNRTASWKQFSTRFSKPVVTSEKVKDYMRLPESDQKALKAVDGWIYRTQVEGHVRNRGSGLPSDLITFDFDYATPEYLESMLSGEICPDWEWFIHTSRRHTEEKPRFRMFILLAEPVPNDLYGPVSRILAQYFDPEMIHVDKVSFRPAQMMFRPTTSKDGQFIHHRNEGNAVHYQDILEAFELSRGDWHDMSLLPITPGEHLRESAEKAEIPTDKQGPVGDFCRAYDVPAAIEKFLSDKYSPVDMETAKPRYTYLGGTTTNGAEVQDDGLFLYSHHGSDPCGDMLVNAFDMVRIHLFGDKDKDHEEEPMGQRPSWKAMVDFVLNDEGYRQQVVKSRYDVGAMNEDFDLAFEDEEVEIDYDYDPEIEALVGTPIKRDLDGAPQVTSEDVVGKKLKRRAPPVKDWITKMELTPQGNIFSNAPNIAQIISNDLRLREAIAYNEFTQRIVLREPVHTKLYYVHVGSIRDRINGEPMEDHHYTAIRMMLESPNGAGKVGYGLRTVTDRDLYGGVEIAARMNSFHPIREYLKGVKWDQRPRMEKLFIDYLGCPDTPYHREIARKFLIGAVARAFEPGHKFDFVPILSGGQGKRKSTFISILAKSWFGELKGDFADEKKLVEQMQGNWIMELPELSSIGRSLIEDVKAFIAAVLSTVRMSYARTPMTFLRQQVFMGSTNDEEYLIDRTGNRRWWPLRVVAEVIDTDKLAREVDMIWAEAYAAYVEMRAIQPKGNLPLHLTDPRSIKESNVLQERARVTQDSDLYGNMISEFLESHVDAEELDDFDLVHGSPTRIRRMRTCVAEVWTQALENTGKANNQDARAVGIALREQGWKPLDVVQRLGRWGVTKVFVPTAEVLARWAKEDKEAGE